MQAELHTNKMNKFTTLADWLTWRDSLEKLPISLDLSRIKYVFEVLLSSYENKPHTITVAGTNGKGSTSAYLESFYLAAGYNVGVFTSPHIVHYNERIKLNGNPVSDELICAAFEKIDAARGETALSFFEFSTLAALLIFSKARVNVQILEVGLGGRTDAVNVVDTDVALITSIAVDHVEFLGDTREKVGLEKAGVFRPHIPAVIGDLDPPISLLNYANEKNTPLFCLGEAFHYQKHGETWTWHSSTQSISDLPPPPLKGEHQYRNVSVAIFATQCLANHLPISHAELKKGLETVKLTGRFQLITGEIPVLLDVAHNPQAAQTLVDYLNEHFPNRRVHAIFSMMKDKDVASVLTLMKPVVSDWYFSPLPNNPRAVNASTMREIFEECQINAVHLEFSGFSEAFAAAKSNAQIGDLILVFGSFFLVADCCVNLNIGVAKNGS